MDSEAVEAFYMCLDRMAELVEEIEAGNIQVASITQKPADMKEDVLATLRETMLSMMSFAPPRKEQANA